MTGFTSLQINSQNRPIQKIDVPASIVSALQAAGHHVEWRRVTPGEDLSAFDVAWVNLAPMNSLNGRAGAMGALWTLSQGVPAVGFFDDWQFSTVFNGARSVAKRPETLYKRMLVGASHRGDQAATHFSHESAQAAYDAAVAANPEAARRVGIERYYFNDDDETVKRYEADILRAVRGLAGPRWSRGLVPACPMYAWGDRSIVRKRMLKEIGPIEPLDPSSTIYELIRAHEPVDPAEKQRQWVLGALMPHDAWVEKNQFSWPMSYVGSRKMVRVYGGQRFKTESDVIAHYNQHWGILSPPYPHAGSGWWRSRFMYAARVRSVLVADKCEGCSIGDAYRYTVADVEKMSTTQLADLAEQQASQLSQWMPAPETFTERVLHIVSRAITEDRGGLA